MTPEVMSFEYGPLPGEELAELVGPILGRRDPVRFLRELVVCGALDHPAARGRPGRRGGRSRSVYSPAQCELALQIARSCPWGASRRDAVSLALIAWIWWGPEFVPPRQVRRALCTYISKTKPSRRELAWQSRIFAEAFALGGRLDREELKDFTAAYIAAADGEAVDASRFDSLDFDPRGVLGIPQRLDRDHVVTLRERVGDPPLEGFVSHVGVHAVLARQAAGLAQLEGSAVTDKTLETLRVIYRGVMWAYGELRPYLCRLRVLADPETPASEWFRPDVFNETAPLFLLVGLGLVGCCDLSPTELNDLTDAFHARPDPSWRPSEPPGFTTTSATAVPLAG